MTSPVVEEWYVPVRALFLSEAEGGSHKTHTQREEEEEKEEEEVEAEGGAELLGLHIL